MTWSPFQMITIYHEYRWSWWQHWFWLCFCKYAKNWFNFPADDKYISTLVIQLLYWRCLLQSGLLLPELDYGILHSNLFFTLSLHPGLKLFIWHVCSLMGHFLSQPCLLVPTGLVSVCLTPTSVKHWKHKAHVICSFFIQITELLNYITSVFFFVFFVLNSSRSVLLFCSFQGGSKW